MASATRTSLQHRVWRWHFFAGLAVVPFVLILSMTGAIYLFKPQYDAAIEQQINAKAASAADSAEALNAEAVLDTALARHEGSSLVRLILPTSPTDRAMEAEIITGQGEAKTLWIDKSSGSVLHEAPTDGRFMAFIKRIHSSLLGSNLGSLLVETMACWAIILFVTGLYLWWPRSGPWWRMFVPDFSGAKRLRPILFKLHGAVGSWVSVLALVMLISGLPWTQVWGEGFTRAKALAGLETPGQVWFVTLQSSDPHAMHNMGGSLWQTENPAADEEVATPAEDMTGTPLAIGEVVEQALSEGFAPPVWLQPPRGDNGVWTVRGMNAKRFKQETVHYDRWSGEEVMRIRFEDQNVVDQTMAVGVSFHEGALFGWINQVLGVIAALGVAGLAVTGTLMWWKRKPESRIGVPPMPADKRIAAGVVVAIIVLGVLLPMAGLTLLICLIADFVWSAVSRRIVA
tara:strand:+ start:5938 stop:7308 length:1371 start_codon:yes stop_codon:yes gene_type:complete